MEDIMSKQDRFPQELLSQPPRARWLYFKNKIVAHPRLSEVHQSLRQAVRYASRGRLILVFGPTGVGKTTLRHGIERALIEDLLPELDTDRERIPVAGVSAVAPERGPFDWIDFYTQALISLNEPLVDDKIAYDAFDFGVPGVRLDERGQVVIQSKAHGRNLRRALENCLRHRRPTAFIIDDAHHLQSVASGRRLRDQMDAIKSLAERSGTVHVLIGTYELMNLTNLSDQLSRRSRHIPFGRYRVDCEQDVHDFKAVLKTLQQHLPVPEEPDLVSQWEYFYEYSAGCVGILKIWLCDALAEALEKGQKTLTRPCLGRNAMAPDRLMTVVREIIEGERKLEEQAGQRGQIRAALGLDRDTLPTEVVATAPKRSRAGERKPVRDPIGG
jgi:energy-coupling factor transporter ATP-binding protein EcfA2